MNIETKLGLNVFAIDKERHITVNQEVCRSKCGKRYCLAVCPAHLYSQSPEGEILLNYEGCLECGTCKLACTPGALDWHYPKGGFGVQYRFG